MNEEEKTIERCNELIDNCNCYLEDYETDDETFKWFEMEKKTIQSLLDLYQKEKEKISKAIAHIEACKTSQGNYILSPNETEYLLKILGKENNGKQM